MKVSELIQGLQSLPQDADIKLLYDLGCSESVDCIWLARNGKVYVCDKAQWFSTKEYLPEGAVLNFTSGWEKEPDSWSPPQLNKRDE